MFGSVQELEHAEFEAGCFSNEFEAAFAHSQATIRLVDERPRIKELTDQGKFVVVLNREVCCPHTDALLGDEYSIHSVHDTREEARLVCAEDPEGMYIAERDEVEPEPAVDDLRDEAPF
jgi:hypothetical protein